MIRTRNKAALFVLSLIVACGLGMAVPSGTSSPRLSPGVEHIAQTLAPGAPGSVRVLVADGGRGSCYPVAESDHHWYFVTAAHCVEPELGYMNEMALPTVDGVEATVMLVDDSDNNDVAILRLPKSGREYRLWEIGEPETSEAAEIHGYVWPRSSLDGSRGVPERVTYKGRILTATWGKWVAAQGGCWWGNSGGVLAQNGCAVGVVSRGLETTTLCGSMRAVRVLLNQILGEDLRYYGEQK